MKKNETNSDECSDISFMHNHTLHDTLHQIYVFISKIGMQDERGGLASDKSFRKTFERKKEIQTNQGFKKNLNKPGIKGVSPTR